MISPCFSHEADSSSIPFVIPHSFLVLDVGCSWGYSFRAHARRSLKSFVIGTRPPRRIWTLSGEINGYERGDPRSLDAGRIPLLSLTHDACR